ncbi:MAG: HesA/MoeB/ThiF family protein [Magnetococcales bacterium]|nr:HesA/MoeB/ThiF family protein [Magnetococcales bacterium]
MASVTTAFLDRLRYSRHLALPGVGEGGQARLGQSRVLIVGAGGLGGPAALYLAAAGVGHLTLVDGDRVETSNLGRQIVHATSRLGWAKVDSARQALLDLNPRIGVETVDGWLDEGNVEALVGASHLVLDGSDNFETRDRVNAACFRHKRPLVTGAALGFSGQVGVFHAGEDAALPCWRCFFPSLPEDGNSPTCETAGVLGALTGIVGSWMAAEALLELSGKGANLRGQLLLLDLSGGEVRRITGRRDGRCPVCADSDGSR